MTDPRQSIDTDKGRLVEITRQFVGVKEDGSERWVETEYRIVTNREWAGLTDAEVEAWRGNYDFFDSALVREVEAKLKEKNT